MSEKKEIADPSQNYLISRLMPLLIDHPVKIVMDVGANDGYNLSNSYSLIEMGWKGILVEPNPHTCNRMIELWGKNTNVLIFKGALSNFIGSTKLFADNEGFDKQSFSSTIDTADNEWTREVINKEQSIEVEVTTISDLLNDIKLTQRNFAYLSVDTEGHDISVLEGLGQFRPSVITTERDVWDVSKAMRKQQLLLGYGYISVYHVGCNEIYVNSHCDYIKSKTKVLSKIY